MSGAEHFQHLDIIVLVPSCHTSQRGQAAIKPDVTVYILGM